MTHGPDLIVLHEHPEWQKPLFATLERRGIAFAPLDFKRAAFSNTDAPRARLYFNQASPSAYVRGNTRAVPFALAYRMLGSASDAEDVLQDAWLRYPLEVRPLGKPTGAHERQQMPTRPECSPR